ncbi:MAG: hypothetical protein Q8916_00815 [Bacteroidota bacterium]|nr:hypothetical protein [Bacteroidota bacterium]MDP4236405.1 hypothetical protein [Bacteroidota bacterium]
MPEIFLRIWDEGSSTFKVDTFELDRIINLGQPADFPPPKVSDPLIKSTFEYDGKRFWSSDEREYISAQLKK